MLLYEGVVCCCMRELYVVVRGSCMLLYEGVLCCCMRELYVVV